MQPLDPRPWALFSLSGIELNRESEPRTASEFSPRPGYEQDESKYL